MSSEEISEDTSSKDNISIANLVFLSSDFYLLKRFRLPRLAAVLSGEGGPRSRKRMRDERRVLNLENRLWHAVIVPHFL